MTRLVHRPIEVTLLQGKPHSFTDGGVTHVIEVIVDWWVEAGSWWEDEASRTVYTIRTFDGGVYDIEQQGLEWRIYRVHD